MRRALEPPFPLGALAVAVFVAMAAKGGGYAPITWEAAALFLVPLATVALVAYGRSSLSTHACVALCALLAFGVWSAASISWSHDRGIAWDGANRTLLYVAVYALFAAVPWRRSTIPILLAAFAVGVLGIGIVDLARSAHDTASFFIKGRLVAPAGYANAACALFVFAAWPVAYLAARREVPALVRAASLACATALVELAVLTQSRGSLVAVPVAVVAYLAIVPARLRAAAAVAVVALAVYVTRQPLLDVFDAVRLDHGASHRIHVALLAIGVSAAAVFVVWILVAVADRRIRLSERATRRVNAGAVGLAAVLVLIAVVASATASPVGRAEKAWRDFKAGYPEESGGSHFGLGLGSDRYDFWRVALRQFRSHPLRGAGVDNFAADYAAERRSPEEPLYPHSLVLRVPAQLGVPGMLLFAAVLVTTALAAAQGVARGTDLAGGMARAGVAASAYFAIHGSLDWFWEFAGLGVPAFAWLGLAASRDRAVPRPARLFRLGTVAVGALLTLSLALPWLAELEMRGASQVWGRDHAAAFARLDRARQLNPLSARPDLLAGAIASRVGDLRRMSAAFSRAVRRDSRSWYGHFELGLARAAQGRRASALRELDTAVRLNPRDEIVRGVRRDIRAGRPVDRARIDRRFLERARARLHG